MLALEGMMNTQRNRGHVSKRLGLSVWNSETTRLSNQRLHERLEAENAQLRRNVVDLMLQIQACAMVPDVAATWPVFDDDASAKTRLHDAHSGWMEFSERTPNHLSKHSPKARDGSFLTYKLVLHETRAAAAPRHTSFDSLDDFKRRGLGHDCPQRIPARLQDGP